MSRFWVGGGSSTNFNAVTPTNWATTSGGANNASVPDSTQAVIFDASSGSGTANISASITVGSLTTAGFTGTITHGAFKLSIGNSTMGDLLFSSGMTYTPTASNSCNISLISTNATASITTAGKTIRNLTINSAADACSYTLLDNLSVTTKFINAHGNFNANGFNVSATSEITIQAGTILMGSGTWTTSIFNGTAATSPGTSILTLTGGGTLTSNGITLNKLTTSGTLLIIDNTILDGTFVASPDSVITIVAGQTLTLLDGVTMSGTVGHLVTLLSDTPGSSFGLIGQGAAVAYSFNYMSITDSNASLAGGDTWSATHSIDGGGNYGWQFLIVNSNKTNNISDSITGLTTIPSPTSRSGTFSSAANGIEVTGSGTSFKLLNKGDWIVDYTNFEVRKIANIYNDIYLTLESGFSNIQSSVALVTVPSSRVVRIDLVASTAGKINNVSMPTGQEIVFDKSSRQDQHSPIDYIDPIFVDGTGGSVFAITQY